MHTGLEDEMEPGLQSSAPHWESVGILTNTLARAQDNLRKKAALLKKTG